MFWTGRGPCEKGFDELFGGKYDTGFSIFIDSLWFHKKYTKLEETKWSPNEDRPSLRPNLIVFVITLQSIDCFLPVTVKKKEVPVL